MLKINEITKSNDEVNLIIEGKIIADWVRELEKQCHIYIEQGNSDVVLDFTGVTYIDEEGLAMLRKYKSKIRIINSQPYIGLCLKNRGLIE